MILQIFIYSFLNLFDGCLISASTTAIINKTEKYGSAVWAFFFTLAHILLGSIGIILSGIISLINSNTPYLNQIISTLALLYLGRHLLIHFIGSCKEQHHQHLRSNELNLKKIFLLSVSGSHDAFIRGLTMLSAQSVNRDNIIHPASEGDALIANFIVAIIVGLLIIILSKTINKIPKLEDLFCAGGVANIFSLSIITFLLFEIYNVNQILSTILSITIFLCLLFYRKKAKDKKKELSECGSCHHHH